MQEKALVLPSGRVVTVLNLIVTRKAGLAAAVLSVQYRTGVPAGDVAARRAEAADVAAAHHALADVQGCTAIRSEVCNTPAAAETREGPEAIFRLVRGADGQWIASGEPGPPSRPAS